MKQSNRFEGKVVIGLTGTIAAGKSTVLHYLHDRYGFTIIDADITARGVVETLQDALIRTFGEDVVSEGKVDRARLGQIVFNDPEKLQALNALVHPATCEAIKEEILSSKESHICIEAIELLRSDLKEMIDEVWVVYADPDLRIRRMMEVRGLTEDAAKSRVQSQWDDASYLARADVVIHSTNGPVELLYRQVDEAVKGWEETPCEE